MKGSNMTSTRNPRRWIALSAAVGLFASVFVFTQTTPLRTVNAAGPVITSTFYVPLFEDNAHAALFSVNGDAGTQLSSTTSITVAAPNTIIYYDQWENGYEATASAPVQGNTLVFGDGNTANGNAATYCVPTGCAGDIMPVGAVLRLNNSATVVPGPIDIPRTTGVVKFDGRDKISATDPVSVTHATWPTAIDALSSEMASAFDTSRWGINFVTPVGTTTPAQGAGGNNFSYSGLEVMAKDANTLVYIDLNNDGDYVDANEVNGTSIGEGQTVYKNGGVPQGARVVTTKPVQVFLMTGRIGSNYEDHSYQVFPTQGLVNDYIAPASTARTTGGAYATVLYLYNPQATAITVTVLTNGVSTNYSIPAGQTLNPAPYLAAGQGARVTSTTTFAAVAAIGTRETNGNSLNYDWGYSLVPARLVLDSIFVSWAPGSQDLSVAIYDPVWLTALAPTTVYVDFDGNPLTGAQTDPAGSRYDETRVITTALASLRITDAGDNDMTGAHLYTLDGVGIAAAYGEDPASGHPVAFPGIDLGTTIFPICGALCVSKSTSLEIDLDGDGKVDPGDTVRWTVVATNTDYEVLNNPVLYDTLPVGTTYVPGSTVLVVNGGLPTPVADDLVPSAATLFPYDENGRQLVATIPVGQYVTVRFDAVVNADYPSSTLCNRGVVASVRATSLNDANGASTTCVPVSGALRIVKTSSANGNPVAAPGSLAYTLVVSNAGGSTLTNIDVTDTLPAGLTYVPGSTSVIRPVTGTTYGDDFNVLADWTGDTGGSDFTAGTWTETDTNGATTTTGRLQKVLDGTGDYSVRFGDNSNTQTTPAGTAIRRELGDLSAATTVSLSFTVRCNDLETGEVVLLQARSSASDPWSTKGTYGPCDNNTPSNVTQTPSLDAGDLGLATEIQFIVGGTGFAGNGTDYLNIDDLVITSDNRINAATTGAAPPNLFTIADLRAGESATITFNTTVSATPPTDELYNIATARTGSEVARADVTDCVRCFDYSDDPASYNGAGGNNPARARVGSLRTYIADTFQSGGFAGSTGNVDWAASSWTETDTGGAGPSTGRVRNITDLTTRSAVIGGVGATTPTDTGLSRLVGSLTGASSVLLEMDYRCSNLAAGDVVALEIRPTGGATAWTSLQTFSNCNNATTYSSVNYALAAANYGAATEVRLRVTNAFDNDKFFFVDSLRLTATYDNTPLGPRLGTVIDREVSLVGGGAPNPATAPNAPVGDDTNGSSPDDEDGVVVPSVDVNTLVVPITVVDSSGGTSYVNGWFDWNNNGSFDAGESIFDAGRFASATGGLTVVSGTGQVPGPGTYNVTVNVPALDSNGSNFAIGDTLYSRFRVSTLIGGVQAPTGLSSDGEVEDYSSTLNTLPVNLSYVSTARRGGSVTIDWRTAQEVDNLGFNIYAENSNGSLKRLTSKLIPSKAPTSVEAQTYQTKVSTRATVLWLEDVALDGATEMHGPYTVGEAYGDARPPAEINWSAATAQVETVMRGARQQARRASANRIKTITSTTATGPVARLEVTEAGVYQITHEQLLTAGVNLAGETAASLAVTDNNGAVAIEVLGPNVFGPGSSVRFLGEPLDTLYTGTNVYWLHVDPALARRIGGGTALTTPSVTPPSSVTTTPRQGTGGRKPTIGTDGSKPGATNTPNTSATTEAPATTQAAPVVPTTDYATTAVTEPNNTYSVTAPGSDPWYDRMLFAFGGSPVSATATVNVTDPVAGQPATATVQLWGITSDDIADEHHVRLSVNGVVVGEARFNDTAAGSVTGTIPAGVLLAGANTLQVTLLADTGVSIDLVAVDSWSISYRRSTVAESGRLDLTTSGQRLDVSGMPNGEVVAYRTADNGTLEKLTTTWNGATLQVPGSSQPQRYVLSSTGALRTPAISPLRTPAKLLDGQADYLIITHAALAGSLQPLVNYHTSQGRLVKVVDVADIYDQYSHGVLDAKAIDDYLAKAVPTLGVRWVLLAGADTVDYRNYSGLGAFSLVPSLYGPTGTRITYTPLDPAYADVNGDGTPDVALGRFPARTPAELTLMISKTLAYADTLPQRTAILASDANDGIDYAAEVDTLADQLAGWTISRADLDRQGVDAARAALIDAMSSGVGLVFYLGHSGSSDWTESGLFDSYAAAALTGPSSVVVQFGCWNTYYVAPDADTLAHALLINANGGAAAVLGSVALTNSSNDTAFARLLSEQLASGTITIGEAVVAAKKALQRTSAGDTSDVQLGWTILGDPAIVAGGQA